MTMNLIPGIEATGSALTAEKIRLEIIAQNIANSNTTQDSDGNVYKRKEVAFEEYIKSPERRTAGFSVVVESPAERRTAGLSVVVEPTERFVFSSFISHLEGTGQRVLVVARVEDNGPIGAEGGTTEVCSTCAVLSCTASYSENCAVLSCTTSHFGDCAVLPCTASCFEEISIFAGSRFAPAAPRCDDGVVRGQKEVTWQN